MTHEEEAEIIRQVLDGNTDAFESLVIENRKNVYNLALRMTGNEQDALDISQEAFLKAFSGLSGFRGKSRFSVWLYRLTYNLCIDLLRKNSRANVVPLFTETDDGEEISVEIPDSAVLPESELEKKELIRAINDAVNGLSPERRQVILLREISGLSYSEIAQVLGVNEGSVKSRISRARKQIANTLIANGTFSPSERQNNRKEES